MRARRLLSLLAVLALAAVVVACDGASGPTVAASSSPGPVVSAPASPDTTPSESVEPSLPEPSEEPTETAEPTPDETEEPSGAADCTGTDDNRKFYGGVAESVDWTLYCPVLPAGWFVDSGEWRAASGGRMEIAYRGPGGSRLELHEGAFCAEGSSCIPPGVDAGAATFGDLEATLVELTDGGWAASVGDGSAFSYLAVGTGIRRAAFLAVTDAFIVVGD